jgi:hypothetical protein
MICNVEEVSFTVVWRDLSLVDKGSGSELVECIQPRIFCVLGNGKRFLDGGIFLNQF